MPNIISKEHKYYVYAHYRATDGLIFYIGKGCGRRADWHYGRNSYWNKVVAKHGFYSRILVSNVSHSCAFSIERMLINVHHSAKLTNNSYGGDGGVSYHTPESRAKISASRRGKAIPAESTARGIAKICKPIINSNGETFFSTREAAKVLGERLGKLISTGSLSAAANGKLRTAYGLVWSYDTSKVPLIRSRRNAVRRGNSGIR